MKPINRYRNTKPQSRHGTARMLQKIPSKRLRVEVGRVALPH